MNAEWEKYREKIIGLGEQSSRKSYYPELQDKIEALEHNQNNLLAIIHNISDGILIHNDKGKILAFNRHAKEFFNLSDDEQNEVSVMDFFADKTTKPTIEKLWDEVLNGKTMIVERNFQQPGRDEEIPMQISLNRTFWNGELAIIGVFRDFSERRKYEEDLIVARKKAEESDRLKSAFLANLSHEIRTPMNAILGFTELLLRPAVTDEKRESYGKIVQDSGYQLLSIIDDIIEISKIETGQITPNISELDIKESMHQLINTMKVTIPGDKNIRLIYDDKGVPDGIAIQTDKVKVCQIATNLLNNAIKYTEKGHVLMACSLSMDDWILKVVVEDTGEGIDPRYHDVIFDRFSRLESDLAIRMGGSGLGLAISKAYAEMLGGDIQLASEVGKGSVFTLTLPVKVIEKPSVVEHEVTLKDIPRGNREKILVAEDDELNYLLFERILSDRNFRVEHARNGLEALEKVRQNSEIKLVLMDIKMPVMDGYEALSGITGLKPALPVIAQTAFVVAEEDRKLQQAGFDAILTKPINEYEMLLHIQRLLK